MAGIKPIGLEMVESCMSCKLRQDRFFCNLERKALEQLDHLKLTATFPPGTTIFAQGQAPRGVNIVCQGKVKLSMASPDGRMLTVKEASDGEVLGLSATITGREHELTAETITHCQLNFIRRDDFLRFLQANQEACFHAAQELSQLHNDTCSGLRLFGLTPNIGARLATLLLKLDAENPAKRRGHVTWPYTHEEIAQQLGASRETVTRLLIDLRKRKILDLRGTIAVILDRDTLERLAAGVTNEK